MSHQGEVKLSALINLTEQYWTRKYNLWRKMSSIVGHNMSECTVSAWSYKVDCYDYERQISSDPS